MARCPYLDYESGGAFFSQGDYVCKLCNILDGHADAPPAMIPETLPVTFPILAYSIAPTAGKVK